MNSGKQIKAVSMLLVLAVLLPSVFGMGIGSETLREDNIRDTAI